MDNSVSLVSKLQADNKALKREIQRQRLVNELNIVLLQDSKAASMPQPTEFFAAVNDS